MQYHKIMKSKPGSIVPKLPEGKLDDLSITYWYKDVLHNLQASPWNIDGTSIYDLKMDSSTLRESHLSTKYTCWNAKLLAHLVTRLWERKLDEILDKLRDYKSLQNNNGVVLLDDICDLLVSEHAAQILHVLLDLDKIRHHNKESMAALHSRLNCAFRRIEKLGYKTINDLFVAYA